jgi:ParB family chromosome partitioning protein
LLDLEQSVQDALAGGDISEGHARTLVGSAPALQVQLVAAIVARGLSVRQTEQLVRRLRGQPTKNAASATPVDAGVDHLEEDLRRALGTKVSVARSRKGGRIVIEYYSDEEFSRLFDRLTGGNA